MAPQATALMPAVPATNDLNDFVRKRDAFVTAMTMLRNAADTASRTALEYYDVVTNNAGNIMPQFVVNGVDLRQMSVAPGFHRGITEEPEEGGKRRRKRNVKPKDPNAPKKPATPFLLFCQTGRETVKNDLGPEATYAEVQEELKRRWENEADKAEWSRVYQRRLGDWKAEMETYGNRKAESDGTAAPTTVANAAPAPAARVSTGGFTAVNASAAPAAAILAAATATEEDEEEEEEEEEEEAPAPTAVTKSPAAPAPAADSDESESESSLSPPPQKAKGKPGRKPKTPIKPPTEAPAATPATASSAKQDAATPASEQPKKKRGRPSKKDLEERASLVAAGEMEATPKRKRNKRRKSGPE